MATGDALGDLVEVAPDVWALCVLAITTNAANGAPASGTAGADLTTLWAKFGGLPPDKVDLLVANTGGTGSLAGLFTPWFNYGAIGSQSAAAYWYVGNGTGSTKGALNDGVALDATVTDKLRHSQEIEIPGNALRMYLQLQSPAGANPTFGAWIVARRRAR